MKCRCHRQLGRKQIGQRINGRIAGNWKAAATLIWVIQHTGRVPSPHLRRFPTFRGCCLKGRQGKFLRNAETLAAEFEGGRHGSAEVSVGPVNGRQYELGRAGVGARHRHITLGGVGEVNDDRRH